MSETREIPIILRRGKEIEFASDGEGGAVRARVVPLVARDYIETLDAIAAAYAETIATHAESAPVETSAVEIIAKLVQRLPELQAKSLRFGDQRVPVEWVLDNLDAADVTELIGHILDVNRVEVVLKNLRAQRDRVEAALAGLRRSSSSPAPSVAAPTTS